MDITYFLNSVEKWAKEKEDIGSVILVGSYARGKAKEDSDVDLVIITAKPESYINDETFVHSFGRVVKTEKEDWGRVTSIRTWYDNGLEVEYGITTPIWISKPLDRGTFRVLSDGYKVILDKENYFNEINLDKNGIIIRLIEISDLHETALEKFNRYQVTNRVRYEENNQYSYKDDYFIDDWDDQKKHDIIQSMKDRINLGGIVAGAFLDDKLIGFACVENEFFGRNKEYLELSYIHVSNEYRNCGIGKGLFTICRERAKDKGARKLYIASHPSVETQNFYRSVGCVLAEEINKEIYDKEPLDIQLEYVL